MQSYNIEKEFDDYISTADVPCVVWSINKIHSNIFNKWITSLLFKNSELDNLKKVFTEESYDLISQFLELVSHFLEMRSTIKSPTDIMFPPSLVSDPKYHLWFNHTQTVIEQFSKNIVSKYTRSKIVDRYFNVLLGREEYLLEDGRYVTTDGRSISKIEIDIQVFPPCFVKRLSKTEYRDLLINEIIDENRK
jgi:hypothetical protein